MQVYGKTPGQYKSRQDVYTAKSQSNPISHAIMQKISTVIGQTKSKLYIENTSQTGDYFMRNRQFS